MPQVPKEWTVPTEGVLSLEFTSTRRPSNCDRPLTNNELEGVWVRLVESETPHELDQLVTDEWKLDLLRVICCDFYFTCSQVPSILECFAYGTEKVEACTMVRSVQHRFH